MTTKRAAPAPKKGASARPLPAGAPGAQPGPWDAPWHRKEDATGWETVYRGTGRRRRVRSIVELELTPEQNEWVDRAAEAAGLSLHDFLAKLIDDARAVDTHEGTNPAKTG